MIPKKSTHPAHLADIEEKRQRRRELELEQQRIIQTINDETLDANSSDDSDLDEMQRRCEKEKENFLAPVEKWEGTSAEYFAMLDKRWEENKDKLSPEMRSYIDRIEGQMDAVANDPNWSRKKKTQQQPYDKAYNETVQKMQHLNLLPQKKKKAKCKKLLDDMDNYYKKMQGQNLNEVQKKHIKELIERELEALKTGDVQLSTAAASLAVDSSTSTNRKKKKKSVEVKDSKDTSSEKKKTKTTKEDDDDTESDDGDDESESKSGSKSKIKKSKIVPRPATAKKKTKRVWKRLGRPNKIKEEEEAKTNDVKNNSKAGDDAEAPWSCCDIKEGGGDGFQCDTCKKYWHFTCEKLTDAQIKSYKKPKCPYVCRKCQCELRSNVAAKALQPVILSDLNTGVLSRRQLNLLKPNQNQNMNQPKNEQPATLVVPVPPIIESKNAHLDEIKDNTPAVSVSMSDVSTTPKAPKTPKTPTIEIKDNSNPIITTINIVQNEHKPNGTMSDSKTPTIIAKVPVAEKIKHIAVAKNSAVKHITNRPRPKTKPKVKSIPVPTAEVKTTTREHITQLFQEKEKKVAASLTNKKDGEYDDDSDDQKKMPKCKDHSLPGCKICRLK